MKLGSILSLVGICLFYQWLFPPCLTPEAWLKKMCAEERARWVGQTVGGGTVRCERIMEGPGKLVTYEYSCVYPGSGFDATFEPQFKSIIEKAPKFEATMDQYRSRGIVVELNLYSSDKKMVAALKL